MLLGDRNARPSDDFTVMFSESLATADSFGLNAFSVRDEKVMLLTGAVVWK